MLTTIPFSGFYESHHMASIDEAEQQMFSDRETGCYPNQGLSSAVFRLCDYGKVFLAYVQEYTESFAIEFKIPSLKFESLDSPREYNFTTDRIFAEISLEDVIRLRAELPPANLAELAKQKFTSRDGFMSYYSPDLEGWGPIEDWDANQVGTVVEAFADAESSSTDGFDHWAEVSLMESAFGNGYPEQWVAEATPGIERLYRIHDYLERRAERAAQAA